MDLPFDLSVAPGLLDAGEDGGIITPYSYREAVELRNTRCLGGLQPSIQIARLAILHHVTKYLGKLFGCSNLGLVVGDYLYPLLLRRLAVGRGFGEPEGH